MCICVYVQVLRVGYVKGHKEYRQPQPQHGSAPAVWLQLCCTARLQDLCDALSIVGFLKTQNTSGAFEITEHP
jgi:hypothetical protein